MRPTLTYLWIIAALSCLSINAFSGTIGNTLAFRLTAEGIGPVKLGIHAKTLPASVAGLYDYVDSDIAVDGVLPADDDMPEFAVWHFYDEQNQELFTATQDSTGIICEISVTSPLIPTESGVHVGLPQEQVDAITGIHKIEPDPQADFPRDSYDLEGVIVWIDEFYDETIGDSHSLVASMQISNAIDTTYLDREREVYAQISPIFKSHRSIGGLRGNLAKIKQMKHVRDAYVNGSTLYVQIDGFGVVSYTYYTNNHIRPKVVHASYSDKYQSADADQFTYPGYSLVIAHQMERDMSFSSHRSFMKYVTDLFKQTGIKNITYVTPSIDFFRHEMFRHNLVLLDTHGHYDAKRDLHWILTSDIYSDNATVNYDLRQQYKKLLTAGGQGSNALSVGYVLESRADGTTHTVGYYSISEEFIASQMASFPDEIPVVIYNTACQSTMGNSNMAKAFHARGAEMYMGYDETESMASYGAMEYFGRLFSGLSINLAYQTLDENVLQSNGAYLRAYYSTPNLVRDHKYCFIIPKMIVEKPWLNSGDMVIAEYPCKMPLHYMHINSAHTQLSYNDPQTMPLLYGVEVSADDKYGAGKTVRKMTKIDLPTVTREVTIRDCKMPWQCMVAFNEVISAPVPNKFFNKDSTDFYSRPFIYEPTTATFHYGIGVHSYSKNKN